jgi:membrane protein YdbS with pleckstrin-like domain
VPHPRHLAAITIPTSTGVFLTLANPWTPIIGCIFLTVVAIIVALLLLPAVWSSKKCRRESAYSLARLIIGSRQKQGNRRI